MKTISLARLLSTRGWQIRPPKYDIGMNQGNAHGALCQAVQAIWLTKSEKQLRQFRCPGIAAVASQEKACAPMMPLINHERYFPKKLSFDIFREARRYLA